MFLDIPYPVLLAGMLVLGIIVGAFSNVTSGGAGILTIFILTSFFSLDIQQATGTILAASTAVVAIGAYSFYRKKEIDVRLGLSVGISGLIGAFLAARFAASIDSTIMERAFGVFTLALACYTSYFFISKWKKEKKLETDYAAKGNSISASTAEQVSVSQTQPQVPRLVGTSPVAVLVQFGKGALIGIVTGLFGVGAASLSIVFFLLLFRLDTKAVLGTSLFASFFRYLGGSVGYVTEGKVSLLLFGILAVGGCFGSVVGARFLLGRKIGSDDIYIKLLQVAILLFVSYEFLLRFVLPFGQISF